MKLVMLQACFQLDPQERATTESLLKHRFLEAASALLASSTISPSLQHTTTVTVTPSGDSLATTIHRGGPQPESRLRVPPVGIHARKMKIPRGSVYHAFAGWPRVEGGNPANFGITGAACSQTQPQQQQSVRPTALSMNPIPPWKAVENTQVGGAATKPNLSDSTLPSLKPSQNPYTSSSTLHLPTSLPNFYGPNCVPVFPNQSTTNSNLSTTANNSTFQVTPLPIAKVAASRAFLTTNTPSMSNASRQPGMGDLPAVPSTPRSPKQNDKDVSITYLPSIN